MDYMCNDAKIYLILHNVRSCYNVGAIFRTADAAGVSKIYLCGYTPTPETDNTKFQMSNVKSNTKSEFQNHDKIAKTALGAEKNVPWEKFKQTWRLLKQLRDNELQIIALEQNRKSKNLFDFKPTLNKSLALLVGHERKGLSKKILEYVDDIVEIPMYGKKESLNVAVATGIALYQLVDHGYK
jgi:tRNA G18 (ribose-2'-O)-methylase SpoU